LNEVQAIPGLGVGPSVPWHLDLATREGRIEQGEELAAEQSTKNVDGE
jgi:hypothetical protein